MTKAVIRSATRAELWTHYGELAAHAEAAHGVFAEDGTCLALAGLVVGDDDRFWMFYDAKADVSRYAVAIVREMTRVLRELNETIFITCDKRFASADRLCWLLGFAPTDEMRNGLDVWAWTPNATR